MTNWNKVNLSFNDFPAFPFISFWFVARCAGERISLKRSTDLMFPFTHGSGNIRFVNLGAVNTYTDKKTNT